MSTATHTEHNKPSAGGSAPAPTNSGQGLRPEDLTSDGVLKVLRDDGSLDPATDPGLGSDEVIALYKAMVRTRMLDERLVTLQRQGRIGFHIGSLGEEACILGSTAGMRDKDWIARK